MNAPVRFLFVDDDEQILRALSRLLHKEGFELHLLGDPVEAIAMIETKKIEVIVCDHVMPVMTGLQVLSEVKARHPKVIRVLASGSLERESTDGERCVDRFLEKPWFAEDLRRELHDLASLVITQRLAE